MTGWPIARLGDKVEILNRKRVPLSRIERAKRPGPYRYYGAQGVIDHIDDFLFEGEHLLVAEDGENLRSRKQPVASLVSGRFWVNNHAHILRAREGVANNRFLLHLINHADLGGFITGAAQPKLTKANLQRMTFACPTKPVQDRIAVLLGALDELIEINERRIELLQDLARSLYREWFVRFRFPGYESTRFCDSEIGRIPKGWAVIRLSEITSQLARGIAPRYADDGSWTVINQRCIRDHRVSLSRARQQERPVPEAKRVLDADVLINSTGVGTLGRVAMFLLAADQVTADSHVTIVRARSPKMQPWLGLSLTARQSEFQAMGVGSTGQTELSREAIGEVRLAAPDPRILTAFSAAAWPLLRAVPELAHYIDHLGATRDLLLPRLVTGRLDISDVDLGDLLPGEAA